MEQDTKQYCALIMAGGKGTRFWPKSTEEKPKQFLNLIDEKTMIQKTYDRIKKVIPEEKIFIVTCDRYVKLLKEQLPQIKDKNIIIEPVGRNTAPCILLATLYIMQIYNEANIIVLPSDHIINKEDEFCNVVEIANNYLNNNKKAIITIGIKPNRPETGYGYIKYLDGANNINNEVIKVERFVEKPNIETAKKYLQSGNYLWNAGMFIFNTEFMLQQLKENATESYNALNNLPSIHTPEYKELLKTEYLKCEAISIDYAVMEKSDYVYVIPADLEWDDIGTWNSLERYIDPDKNSNVSKGNVQFSNANNCIVYGENKKIILIDVDNVFCTEGEDTIIISSKQSINKVKDFRK